MKSRRDPRIAVFYICALTLTIALAATQSMTLVSASGNPSAPQKSKSSKNKDKKSKGSAGAPQQAGTPAIWESRGDISKLNLLYGIGSAEGLPKAPFQF